MKKTPQKKSSFRGAGWMIVVFLGVALIFVFLDDETQTTPAPAPRPAPEARSAAPAPEPEVPPFHPDAESARPFPALLEASRFEIPVVSAAYRIANEMPEVLAQQPCYCNCGVFGHESLLDCFASDHGAT